MILRPLIVCLALALAPAATAQEGDAVAAASADVGEVEGITGRDPTQLKAYNETAERFKARMREFEQDARTFLDEREGEERLALTEGYDALIQTLTDLEVNQRGMSIERFESFLERYPDAPYASHVRFRLAELYYETASEEWLDATDAYYLAIDDAGEDFELLEDLGEEPKVDLTRPVELYMRIIADNRDLPPEERYEFLDGAYYMLGFCLRDNSTTVYDPDASRDSFDELVTLLPDSRLADDAHLFLGMHYFDGADWDAAIAEYRAVFDKGPDNSRWYVEAMYQLAWSYYKQSKYDLALDLFVSLLEHSEETFLESGRQSDYRPDAIKYMAISFVDIADQVAGSGEEGDPVAAADSYFSRQEPSDFEWDVYVELGEVLILYQRFANAVKVYEKLQADPRWLDRPENPQFQMKVVQLLASGHEGSREEAQAHAAQARLEMTEMYSDRSGWWEANRNNPDALATARNYIEDSLSDVAREYRFKADALRDEVGVDMEDTASVPDNVVAAYALAGVKFREYLEKFPISDDYYEMQWYLADTLYKAQDWSGAEAEYEALIKSKDYHPYGEGSLFLLFRTRQKVIQLRYPTFDELPPDAVVERTYTSEWGKEITVYQLPVVYEKFIASGDLILEHRFVGGQVEGMPNFQEAVDTNRRAIMYIPAQVLYHHGRYEEARPRLRELVDTYRRTREACFAGGLLVDSYRNEGDLQMLRQLANDFARNPICVEDPLDGVAEGPTTDDFIDLEQDSAYKIAFTLVAEAQALEEQGRNEEAWDPRERAAEAFLQYIADYPTSDNVPLSLYNAANNYQIIGKPERANELFEEYVNRYPDDERSKSLYMRIAGNYESTFDLDKAIRYYQDLVRLFPKYEDSPIAMYNAAFLKIGIGDHQGAARAFEYYATAFKQEDAQEVFFQAGEQWELVGDREALAFYDRYLRRYGTSDADKAMEAHYRVASIYKEQGNERMYQRKMDDILSTFDKLAASEAEIGWEGRHYAAQSAFRALQEDYDEFTSDELFEQRRRNEEKNLKLLMETKPAQLDEFEASAMALVNRYKDFEYSSAALFLVGSAYIYYVDLGFGLTCPEDYKEDECMIYEEILWDSVYPVFEGVEKKGKTRLAALVQKSQDEKLHNEWIDKAQLMLNARDPFAWPAIKPEIQGESDATIYPEIVPLQIREDGEEDSP